jgi:hypothetical protein
VSTSTERPPIVVNPENQWRLESPGAQGWERSVVPGASNKYFIVSVDNHLGPPITLFHDRIDKRFVDRLPRMEKRDGKRYLISGDGGRVSFSRSISRARMKFATRRAAAGSRSWSVVGRPSSNADSIKTSTASTAS